MVIVKLGALSHREGKVYHFDSDTLTVSDGNPGWAKSWEQLSSKGGPAHHVPGWKAGDTGSVLHPEEFQKLAGPWTNGADPALAAATS
jgi:hypothetical protein